ncbi:zinc-binding metallopeptidase family protein [Reyranella sp.]|uniref:zinc-binding metallopeptidase family protein n=1 Tax=Reyranella sp. TaxID=1929291 RepID=UPI003BAD7573
MRLYTCQSCQQVVHFENTVCGTCGHRLGFLPQRATVSAVEPDAEVWRALAAKEPDARFLFCANAAQDACNWLVESGTDRTLCLCCRHNRTIPDLSDPANLVAWQRIEMAKHRLFYSLLRLGLPLVTMAEDPERGLAFDVLADPPDASGPRVLTGHDNGLITLALAEADDAYREKSRVAMHEPYRTLLGHFRHEIGHYYWDRLVRDGGRLEACRALFGDDSQDYAQALQSHYANGAPPEWQARFVSAYATSHPWEDFAETWAHYLHIVDTLETARAFGLSTQPVRHADTLSATVDFDPYRATNIAQLIDAWIPLTLAMNSLNRAMGQPDLYPFVLSPPAIEKLGFVHDLVHPS